MSRFSVLHLLFLALSVVAAHAAAPETYDARIKDREVLTPAPSVAPRFTGPTLFGVRPGKPLRFRVSATGEKPLAFTATGLPPEATIDPDSGWIAGRAPVTPGDFAVTLTATNRHATATRKLILRVGETIALTPPMGWNSWYVHSEGVSDRAVREIAVAMRERGLTDHGWTYLNIDDCWMGERDPETLAIQPNDKFADMADLVSFVNVQGLKLGLYSTPWMSTYAGYIGGTAPNAQGDYSASYLPADQRQNPHQLFGRYPNGIRKGLAAIGPVWLVDRDARQFADWGVDYVKYDWKEWTLEATDHGFKPSPDLPQHKTLESGITRRVYQNFRNVDRDIVISLSPDHDEYEDTFVPDYCNLWRLTGDIHAEWSRLIAPFGMADRLQLTRPGAYGDLDMLQIGPLGRPNRAEVVFKPSPLTPNEQYFQVTLWCILTQPLLLSCDIVTMDDFDLNLVTNDEVLAVDQDPLVRQGRRLAHEPGIWEIWAKELADGDKAVALFNLSGEDRAIDLTVSQLGATGLLRDLWRQRDIGPLGESRSIRLSPHGAALLRFSPTVTLTSDESATRPPLATTRTSISDAGAVGDGETVNTRVIQSAIDRLADAGGGVVVVPPGTFVSGALDLRPGVHLHLEKNAVLRASSDVTRHFPPRLTRIEGRIQLFTPALINASQCDGLRITGEGVLDGCGRPVWDEFWRRFEADRTTRNLDVPRARLVFVADSRDVRVEGVSFRDSQFWNLHFFRCQNIVVRDARFLVPDDYKQAPSTDAIDIDSSQDVRIERCYFSVTDDCVAMKGNKGPLALEDAANPPVERITVSDCDFRRGHAALTLGSEATTVRNVILENSRVTGSMFLLHIKMRPDTPQRYESITVRDIALDSSGGRLISATPWRQYFDIQGHRPPQSIVRDITLSGLTGRFGSIGVIEGNPGQTTIDRVVFRDLDLALSNDQLRSRDVKNLRLENVTINGNTVESN